ncbi:uncharacterized protein LOC127240108 [Andrographis paniculata]|uniref:uncharacterized protein LOC127240108 n=1 Tax=Andrographis paniculata TaxID=175694 RepID=UPI0021E7E949|nr:uncharacterized protein LOC127240108 [Andrographis paniculata]
MTTNASNIEDQLVALAKVVEGISQHMLQQDNVIAKLLAKLDKPKPTSHNAPEAQDEAEASTDQRHGKEKMVGPMPFQTSSDSFIHLSQLDEYIKGALKREFEGSSKPKNIYAKPYTSRIDTLKMPLGYQPPKFQQFDGKGKPKQHVAHFMETCNNGGTYGDLLVNQFVRSLKGNGFDWYIKLEVGSIDSWEQLEYEFLNRFYSTKRTVSMTELTNTRQWKDEPTIDYINRWRSLSLNCKNRLSEASGIEMCVQGMQWGLKCILQGIRTRTFEELATRANDLELSIASSGMYGPPVQESSKAKRYERYDAAKKGNNAPIKSFGKEALAIKANDQSTSEDPK